MILINQLTSAIIQLLILTFIPFVWYIISKRNLNGFFEWIGIKKPNDFSPKIIVVTLGVILTITILPYIWLYNTDSLNYSGFTIDSFRASGWSIQTMATIFIWAVIQTSLSEEIFFRGFLSKRLTNKFGFIAGNTIQAIMFGIIHFPSMLGSGLLSGVIIFLLTGGIGYLLGWILLKKANGSIIPGWIIHASINMVSSITVFLFLI